MASLVDVVIQRLGIKTSPFGTDAFSRFFFYGRDIKNVLRHGISAPRSAQLIYIDPRSVKKAMSHLASLRVDTGLIKNGDWDLETHNINSIKKIRGTKQRILRGAAWEKTSCWSQNMKYIKRMDGADGVRTVDDVVARYKRLDKFISSVRKNGNAGFKSRSEINPGNFRESSGRLSQYRQKWRSSIRNAGMPSDCYCASA